jgi:hypothetical protein
MMGDQRENDKKAMTPGWVTAVTFPPALVNAAGRGLFLGTQSVFTAETLLRPLLTGLSVALWLLITALAAAVGLRLTRDRLTMNRCRCGWRWLPGWGWGCSRC